MAPLSPDALHTALCFTLLLRPRNSHHFPLSPLQYGAAVPLHKVSLSNSWVVAFVKLLDVRIFSTEHYTRDMSSILLICYFWIIKLQV